eukprot:gene8176-1432_t
MKSLGTSIQRTEMHGGGRPPGFHELHCTLRCARAISNVPRSITCAKANGRALGRPANAVAVRFSDTSPSDAGSSALNNNTAFQAIFAQSLARTGGKETLTHQSPEITEEMEGSNTENVLRDSLDATKVSYHRLVSVAMELDRAIERETTQIERLEFILTKSKSDRAYYNTLQKMVDRGDKPPRYVPQVAHAPHVSPVEELVTSSLEASWKNLASLRALHAETAGGLRREKGQLERLAFAHQKCIADAAYYSSLKMMLEEGEE